MYEKMAETNPSHSSQHLSSLAPKNLFNSVNSSPLKKYKYLVESVTDSVLKAQSLHTQFSSMSHLTHTISPSKTPTYWWNHDCQQALSTHSTASREYRQLPSIENLMEFKRCEANAKRTFKKTKRSNWRAFCSKVNRNILISKIWNFVKRFKNRYLNSFSSPSLSQNFIPKNIASNLISTSFPLSCFCPPLSSISFPAPSHSFPIHPFNFRELESVLKRINKRICARS